MMDDLPLDSKSSAMVERLDALHQARIADREIRDAARREAADPRENIAAVLSEFTREKSRLDRDLQCLLKEGLLAADNASAIDHAKSILERVAAEITHLEATCAQSSYFLPPYEQRSIATGIAALRANVDETRIAILPRKKFRFVRRGKNAREEEEGGGGGGGGVEGVFPVPLPTTRTPPSSLPPPPLPPSISPPPPPPPSTSSTSSTLPPPSTTSTSTTTLSHRSKETILLLPSDLAGRDVTLSHLTDCTIHLLGSLTALRLHQLTRCTLLSGPIRGSCFLDTLTKCTIHLAAYQVRVHHTTETTLCMRVKSRPIIEHCDAISVAPYGVEVGGGGAGGEVWHGMMRAARLELETGMWREVDDFGWIKAVASPHWVALEESKWPRIAVPDVLGGNGGAGGGEGGEKLPPSSSSITPSSSAPAPNDDNDEI